MPLLSCSCRARRGDVLEVIEEESGGGGGGLMKWKERLVEVRKSREPRARARLFNASKV